MSPRFSCVSPGVWKLSMNLLASDVAHLVHVEWLYLIKPMVGDICWRLMLLLVMGVGFEKICSVSGSKMSPGLFQDFMDGYIKYCNSSY